MHQINKLRLQAGLPIDPSYEVKSNVQQPKEPSVDQIVEASSVVIEEKLKVQENSFKNEISKLEKLVEKIYNSFSSEILEEQMFKKNQEVEDVKTGYCYKIIKPVGQDDSDDVVYEIVCPKTGEISKKSASSLRAKQKEVKEAMDVLNVKNDEKQDKTPAVVTPQPQKTKVPAFIKKDLSDAIKHFKDESSRLKIHDEANALFQEQIADALERIEDLIHNDIKQAQIFITTLMGPILHKIPSSVCKFIYSGGDNSLKTFFNK